MTPIAKNETAENGLCRNLGRLGYKYVICDCLSIITMQIYLKFRDKPKLSTVIENLNYFKLYSRLLKQPAVFLICHSERSEESGKFSGEQNRTLRFAQDDGVSAGFSGSGRPPQPCIGRCRVSARIRDVWLSIGLISNTGVIGNIGDCTYKTYTAYNTYYIYQYAWSSPAVCWVILCLFTSRHTYQM